MSVRAPVGEVNQADRRYVIGRGLAAVRFHNDASGFGWHTLRFWCRELEKIAQGTTFTAVGRKELEGLRISYFSPGQNRFISKVLDAVDEAIAKTEAVIAKLRQVRTGLLRDLLTRGLDENGHLRDPETHQEEFSNCQTGFLPKPWRIMDLGSVAFVTKLAGFEYTSYFDYSHAGDIIVIRVLNIRDGQLDLSNVHTIPTSISKSLPRSILSRGDIVLSYVGTIGEAAIIEEDNRYHLAPNVSKITPNKEYLVPKFLLYLLLSNVGKQRLFNLATLTSQSAISMERIRQFPVFLPSKTEQESICEVLDAHSDRINAEVTYLEKLGAIKRGLTADLLTGRVRMAPNLEWVK